MRIIKSFNLFESGLSYREYEPIKTRIKEILDTHYYPNASTEKNGNKLNKQYLVFITPNESRFGTMIDVTLRFGDLWIRESEWGEDVEIGDIVSGLESYHFTPKELGLTEAEVKIITNR